MTANAWIHIVTLICHTVVLVAIVITFAILASANNLTPGVVAALSTLGGITGGGLVINGRKVPTQSMDQQGRRASDS